MKIIKVISNKTYEWVDDDNVEHVSNYENYYLELDNKRWIAIRPSFARDYAILGAIAYVVDNRCDTNDK